MFLWNREMLLVWWPSIGYNQVPKQQFCPDAILTQHWPTWRNPAPDTQYGYNVDIMWPNRHPASQYWYSITAILNIRQPFSADCYPAVQYRCNPDGIVPNRLPVKLDGILPCSVDAMLTQYCQTGFLLGWMASCRAVWMQCWRNTAKQASCYAGWHPAAQCGYNADAILLNRLPFRLDGILPLSMDTMLTHSCQTGILYPVIQHCINVVLIMTLNIIKYFFLETIVSWKLSRNRKFRPTDFEVTHFRPPRWHIIAQLKPHLQQSF